jgi:hypothetical protein
MSEEKNGEAARKEGEVPWWRNDPWLGHQFFRENRNKNAGLALQYEGMHVAWFPDGSGIRDADKDGEALLKRIIDSGDDHQWYVFEYVEPRY